MGDTVMSDVALYIMMYADLPDMTGGKCAAQAAHASTMCTLAGENYIANEWEKRKLAGEIGGLDAVVRATYYMYNAWKGSTNQGFGTTLVFRSGRDEDGFCMPVDIFTAEHSTLWGVVIDPTYPYRDVDRTIKTMHTPTCSWFLADRANEKHKATLDSIHKEYPFILF